MTLPGEALIEAGITPEHPGEFFADRFLRSCDRSVRQAAQAMELEESTLVAFTEQRLSVDRRLAERLARYTQLSPMFWLNMQYASDLALYAPLSPEQAREFRMAD